MKQTIFLLSLFLLSIAGFSQTDCDSIPEKFFQIFEQKGSDAAIDYIYSTNKFIQANIQASLKVKTELKKIALLVGQYHGHELINKKNISKSYVQLYYLAKFDRQPLKFIFVLYKPDKIWQLQKLKFDDKVAIGFKEE
ncbi:MAG: hypothetical protein DRP35_07925 [Candidatus Zixiibacteriota bacterium]|nr:MAG: hypothetical protein DRP35_07925 [candidate division Zixibacteria bacterium]